MNKTKLEIDRTIILNRSGKPHYSEKTNKKCILDHFVFIAGKMIGINRHFKSDARPSPSFKILILTTGSCHGFGKDRFYHGCYQSNLFFSVFPCFSLSLEEA